MWLLLLEALLALMVLVFIVWWTMFSGRPAAPVPDNKALLHNSLNEEKNDV